MTLQELLEIIKSEIANGRDPGALVYMVMYDDYDYVADYRIIRGSLVLKGYGEVWPKE